MPKIAISQPKKALNKRFKRDFQRAAFLLCVSFSGYGVMRKFGSSVVSPLSGRYAFFRKEEPWLLKSGEQSHLMLKR